MGKQLKTHAVSEFHRHRSDLENKVKTHVSNFSGAIDKRLTEAEKKVGQITGKKSL